MTTKTHTIVQFTDSHLDGTDSLYGVVDPAANLERAIAHAREHVDEVDAIVLTGDLANAGEPEAYAQLAEITGRAATEFGVPVLCGMGNHDTRETFRAGLLGGEPAPAGTTPAPYASDGPGAPVDYVADLGGLRLIMLDSTTPGDHYGVLDDTQIDWMSDQLATHTGTAAIVGFHHPPMPHVPDVHLDDYPSFMADIDASIRFEGLDRLEAALVQHRVAMVISGHFHDPRGSRLGNTAVWAGAASAMTYDFDGRAEEFKILESIGYSVIQVFDNGTAIASAIDATPPRVLAAMGFDVIAQQVEAH